MRLLRLILEGLLVAAISALVFYLLRGHVVLGLISVILICLIGLGVIAGLDRRTSRQKAVAEQDRKRAPTKYRVKTADGSYEPASPPPSIEDLNASLDQARVFADQLDEERAAEQRPMPSFDLELGQFRRIDRDYNGDDTAWTPVIDQWVEDVRSKLETWNPRNAQRFMASSLASFMAVSSVTIPFTGRPDLVDYPELRRLHMHRNRLREITGQ